MSKKILILVNETVTNKNSFYDGIKKRLPAGADVEIAHFEDTFINIDGKSTSVLINGKEIKDYDLVYFRRAGSSFLWLAATIAIYLEKFHKKYIDTIYKSIGPAGTKLAGFLKLDLYGLPMIPSVYCNSARILGNSSLIVERLGLPLVAKDLYSQRGLGVSLIKKMDDFTKLLKASPGRKFMFQKYIEKKEEFRVLVLGNKIGSYERKTSQDPNEFRNNVSLGAREDFMDISEISDEVKNISIKAANLLKLEIAGVDVVIDKQGKAWLLEVNRGPGFTYNSLQSQEIENIAKFLNEY